jgi:hypothetical protein
MYFQVQSQISIIFLLSKDFEQQKGFHQPQLIHHYQEMLYGKIWNIIIIMFKLLNIIKDITFKRKVTI